MHRFARFVSSYLAVGACAMAWPAFAQSDEADAAMSQGVALRRERRDAEALEAFRRAYAKVPSARALAQIALASGALEHWVDAETDLARALASTDDAWVTRNRAQLESALAEIQGHIAEVTIATNVEGAAVWIDGALAAQAPTKAPLHVAAGRLVLEVRAEGYQPLRVEINAAPRQKVQEVAMLTPLVTATPALAPAPVVTTAPAPELAPPRTRTLAWVAAGGAAGLLGVGVGSTLYTSKQQSDYDDRAQCGAQPSVQCSATRSRFETARTLGAVSYVLAGAGAITSAVLFVSAAPAARPRQAFGCGFTGFGIACEGRY